jgi:hypothetical protein
LRQARRARGWRRCALIRQQRRDPFLRRGKPVEGLPALGAYPGSALVAKCCWGGDMDGRRVVQRLVNGETALEIARSFGYQSPTPVMDAARDFIVAKLGAERYSALADQPGMGYVRIARTLGKEALKKD